MIVDIAFALDCTGSMQGWIDAAKRQIRSTIQELSREHAGATFRVGAVLYRDFGDTYADFDEHRCIPFTTDLDEFQRQIADVTANGGNDAAEDVAGAFAILNNLVWQGNIRMLFHITDAPAHGRRYHAITLDDRFPDEDPRHSDLEDEVFQLASKGIALTIVKANHSVDKMIEEFASIYARVPTSRFQVHSLEGQATPPRVRRETTLSPPALRRLARRGGIDTPEMRTLTHMVSSAVQESMSVAEPE